MILHFFMLFSSVYLVFAIYVFRNSIKYELNLYLVNFIIFFLLVKVVLYYLMPAFFRLILNGYDLNYTFSHERVDPFNVAYVYMVEVISYSIYFAVLSFLFKNFSKKRNDAIFDLGRFNNYGFFLCYLFSVGFIVTRITSIIGYESFIISLYTPLFYSTGLVCGPLLLADCLREFKYGKFFVSLSSFAVAFLTVGSRGAIVYSVILATYYVFFVIRSRTVSRGVLICGAFLFVFLIITGGAFKNRVSFDNNNRVSITVVTDPTKSQGRNIADEVIWRFGALTRYSSAFFDLYHKGQSASYFPIYHSLQGFLPRSIKPDKAIPNTVDPRDIYSQGMYLIVDEVVGIRTTMSEFSTASHFYWEFGWLGVSFLSIVSAVYLFCALKFNSMFGIAVIPLTIAVMKPWGYMDLKIWTAEAILQIYQIFVPLVSILIVLIVFSSLKRLFPIK